MNCLSRATGWRGFLLWHFYTPPAFIHKWEEKVTASGSWCFKFIILSVKENYGASDASPRVPSRINGTLGLAPEYL